jgi:acetyltransferase-like isoleucine patch superfamily enzyme
MNEPLSQVAKVYWLLMLQIQWFLSTLFARIKYWPSFKVGSKCKIDRGVTVRQFFMRDGCLKIVLKGENKIFRDTHFQGTGIITFGHRSFCGLFCIFGCNERINIGDNVLIADAVTIRDTSHVFKDSNALIISQGFETAPVEIEDDVWIGHGATILKGVRIGRGAVVAAGSVVNRNVEPFTVVGGIPAKKIGCRDNSENESAV